MGAISYERIKIEGGLGITEIKQLEIHIEANKHATARILGRISKKQCKEVQSTFYEKHIVKIIILEEDGSEPIQPIFSGYPGSITFGEEEGNCYLEIILYSGTILLDREKRSQSFQDISKDYSFTVKELVKQTPKAAVICMDNMKAKPAKPVIQYMETDWEFVLRLASHIHGSIYPEVRQPYPRFWFGMPNTTKIRKITSETYETGISKMFFVKGGVEAGLKQKDFLYYKIDSTKDYDVGDIAQFQNRELIICKKTAKLIRGELIFQYTLGKEQLVSLKRRYNPIFAGMSILGKVIKVEGETVRIHLDIDKEAHVDTSYAYDWVPDTGSTMYCMPKVGSTVSLYFSNEEESSAQAVNCINTGSGGVLKQERKCLSTEYGKELYLGQSSLGFLAGENTLELSMKDLESIDLKSNKKVSVTAEGKVKLVGKNVVMNTPVELKLAKK